MLNMSDMTADWDFKTEHDKMFLAEKQIEINKGTIKGIGKCKKTKL